MDNKYNEKELLAKIGELTMRSEQLTTARVNSVAVDGECATVAREEIESLASQVLELRTVNARLSMELAEAMESAARHLDSAIRSGEILQETVERLDEMRDCYYGRTSKIEAWRRTLERMATDINQHAVDPRDLARVARVASVQASGGLAGVARSIEDAIAIIGAKDE